MFDEAKKPFNPALFHHLIYPLQEPIPRIEAAVLFYSNTQMLANPPLFENEVSQGKIAHF